METYFEMELSNIQPSQLYISEKKFKKIIDKIKRNGKDSLGIIPIKKLNDEIVFTDGHTRAFAAYKLGFTKVNVAWENEDLDWELYEICVQWCKDEKIFSIMDLADRVIDHKDYEILWYKRCNKLHKEIEAKRKK